MNYKNCTITIGKCQAWGWRDWWEYTVTNGTQSLEGRSRGTKREVVSHLKWQIDHNEMFPRPEGKLTQVAVDSGEGSPDFQDFDNDDDLPLCTTCGVNPAYANETCVDCIENGAL